MELSKIGNITELKEELGNELNRAATSFVKIGYLLKLARDTDILKDSSYSNVNEFASAEFGLDKTQVSRFIRINDRFAIGGYSETLKVEYNNYGSAKLSLMLTLPDEINEELSPQYSKSDIETIKAEYEAEQKISDLEVMMEEKPDGPDDFLAMVIKELNDEHPESATYLNTTIKMAEKLGVIVEEQDIREAYIPEGTAAYFIRISGRGRYEIGMKESGIVVINLRDPADKTSMTWEEFKKRLMKDMEVREFPEEEKKPERRNNDKVKPAKPAKPKENRYVEEVRKYHEREEVAPVQPERIPEEDTEIIPAKAEIIPTGQCMDNAPQDIREVEENIQENTGAAGGTIEEPKGAAGVVEADTAAGVSEKEQLYAELNQNRGAKKDDDITSGQREVLDWLDLIRRKVLPEDGSRPDWVSIRDELKTMERYVSQFTI